MDRMRWARACGALGAVVLLTTPLTYFFTAPSDWLTGLKAAVGGVCLGLFVALRRGQAGSGWRPLGRTTVALAALALAVAANVLAVRIPWRWDLTHEKIHSLAPQTLEALHRLPQSIRVVALVPASHPSRDALEQLLREYRHASRGRLDYVIDDVHHNPALAARYGLREGEMAVILERADGAHTALAAVSESELTQALLRLSGRRELQAYFLMGHGEAPPERTPLQGLSQALVQEGYRLAALRLDAVAEVPRDADLLFLAGPQTPLAPPEVERLARYLDEGGHLVVLTEPNGTLGVEELLSRWGVVLDPGVVAEPPPPGVDSPYVLVTASYGEHAISRVLRQGNLAVQLITARGLTLLREGTLPGVTVEPVVFSGPSAWEESQPDAAPQPSSGEKVGRLVLAAASRRATPPGATPRSAQTRLFVLGEADLVRDVLWGNEANRNLILSAVAWAADPGEGGVAVRPVDRTASSLALSLPALRQLRFWSVDVLPLALLALALLSRRAGWQ